MTKVVKEKTIHHDDYKDCLFNKNPQKRKMNVIRSRRHDVFSETVNKVALNHKDDKRIIRENDNYTCARGHFKTKSRDNSVSSGTS